MGKEVGVFYGNGGHQATEKFARKRTAHKRVAGTNASGPHKATEGWTKKTSKPSRRWA